MPVYNSRTRRSTHAAVNNTALAERILSFSVEWTSSTVVRNLCKSDASRIAPLPGTFTVITRGSLRRLRRGVQLVNGAHHQLDSRLEMRSLLRERVSGRVEPSLVRGRERHGLGKRHLRVEAEPDRDVRIRGVRPSERWEAVVRAIRARRITGRPRTPEPSDACARVTATAGAGRRRTRPLVRKSRSRGRPST